jgi:hypothetical protein
MGCGIKTKLTPMCDQFSWRVTMNSLMKTLAATAVAMGAGSGAMAQMDVSTLTCGDFMAQEDDAARLEAAQALLMWIADTANFEAVGPLERYKMDPTAMAAGETATTPSTETDAAAAGEYWTADEMATMIKARCFHQPSDANVLARLKGQD